MTTQAPAEVSARGYLLNWLALLGLTALTFGVAHIDLGGWNTPVALAIALVKAVLIALVFMNLLHGSFTQRFVLVGAGLLVLLLTLVVLLDTSTRFPLATPPGSTRWEHDHAGQLP